MKDKKKGVVVDLSYKLDATNSLPLDYAKPLWGLKKK